MKPKQTRVRRRKAIRCLDLFCGAGGSSIGARLAGATPVAGVDSHPVAAMAFRKNFPRAAIFENDLTKLTSKEVRRKVGAIELLLASPECTHHSLARGRRRKFEKSRSLAFEVLRFARVLRPRWMVIENVVQMMRWAKYRQWFRVLTEDLGYKALPLILDARDFGVPQSRRRLFILCDQEVEPSPPEKRRGRKPGVAGILRKRNPDGGNYVLTPLVGRNRAAATIIRAKRAISHLGRREPFLIVYYGSDGAGGWQTLDRPLRTITTLDRFALVVPNCTKHLMRMLQPPELASAMGFPKQYRWPKLSRRDKIRLIGNAVCPPVMKAIVESLIAVKK